MFPNLHIIILPLKLTLTNTNLKAMIFQNFQLTLSKRERRIRERLTCKYVDQMSQA